jgi:hypothetical protein
MGYCILYFQHKSIFRSQLAYIMFFHSFRMVWTSFCIPVFKSHDSNLICSSMVGPTPVLNLPLSLDSVSVLWRHGSNWWTTAWCSWSASEYVWAWKYLWIQDCTVRLLWEVGHAEGNGHSCNCCPSEELISYNPTDCACACVLQICLSIRETSHCLLIDVKQWYWCSLFVCIFFLYTYAPSILKRCRWFV